MLLADKKKRENISEYIIYMYQTELLIRNFEFDLDKIEVHVLGNIPAEKLDDSGREELLEWYDSLITKMRAQDLQKEGHLDEVQEIIRQLSDLSLSLQVENEDYRGVFNAARPAIRQSIIESDGLINDPVQACVNGVFGLLLARMNGREVSAEQLSMVDHFGNVLSLLSYHYGNSK